MKKTLTSVLALGVLIAVPAFAHDASKHVRTETNSYTETTTYRTVRTPLTPEQIAERQRMITGIEQDMKKVDLDNDRLISFDEYAFGERRLQADGQDAQSSFDQADTNTDGKLNSQEILEAQLTAKASANAPVIGSTYTSREVVRYNNAN